MLSSFSRNGNYPPLSWSSRVNSIVTYPVGLKVELDRQAHDENPLRRQLWGETHDHGKYGG